MANLSESPIKHTEGGEMPDATPQGEAIRRVAADASLLGSGRGAIILGFIGLLGLVSGLGYYFYSKRSSSDLEQAA